MLGASSNTSNDLKTFRLNASYYYHRRYGAALGYFTTTGSEDAGLYATGDPTVDALAGYANNKPDSKGWVAELYWVPYANTKFALQYTLYNKFNGGGTNHNAIGRNGDGTNTPY